MKSRRSSQSLAVTCALVLWICWGLGLVAPLDRYGGDLLVRTTTILPDPAVPFAAILIDDSSVAELGALPWPRDRLAAVVTAAYSRGARAVILDLLLAEASPGDGSLAAALEAGPYALAATLGPANSWIAPTDELGGLLKAAHAHAEIDEDGVVRVFSSSKQNTEVSLPAMAVVAAEMAGMAAAPPPGYPVRPDYRTTPDEISQTTAAELLLETGDLDLLAERVVFIGISASGAGDQMVTPVNRSSRPTPGVLVHAAAAAAIVNGNLLTQVPGWGVLLACLAIASTIAELRYRRGRLAVWPLVAVALSLILAAIMLTWWFHLLTPVATLLSSLALTAAATAAVATAASQRQVDRLLAGLVRGDGNTAASPGLDDRLQVVHELQSQLTRDRDLRQTLMDGLEEGVALWDEHGSPVLCNRSFELLWGAHCHFADMPDHTAEQAAEPSLEHNGRQLSIHLRPLSGGHLALVRDITTEAALERRRREMQRLVSHELKTPLASLSGFGEMLERYKLTDDELHHTAGLIRREADRLGAMVRNFLDLERMDAESDDADRTRLDLGELVRERCAVLEAAARERQIQLLPCTEATPVDGVETRLMQVIDNLIGNAVKYATEGTTVRISTTATDEGCVLIVADEGPGIAGENQTHLFERFYRVPGSTAGGTGLGLALVAEVVNRHGGHVKVDSAPGQGTTFTVTLPTSPTEEP